MISNIKKYSLCIPVRIWLPGPTPPCPCCAWPRTSGRSCRCTPPPSICGRPGGGSKWPAVRYLNFESFSPFLNVGKLWTFRVLNICRIVEHWVEGHRHRTVAFCRKKSGEINYVAFFLFMTVPSPKGCVGGHFSLFLLRDPGVKWPITT